MTASSESPLRAPHFLAHPGERSANLASELEQGMDRTCDWLLTRQHADGYWCGELEGDTILESEFLILLAWLGKEETPLAIKAAKYIVEKQLPSGGWAMYPGGQLEISQSVKAYFALKLTGHDPQAEYMRRACKAIRSAGGADAVNSFTRFYLALLGQISYDICPAVPPELILLPKWFPVNIYRMSAWSRTIVVPLSIMWAHRPVKQLPEERGIGELYLREPSQWPALRCPGMEAPRGIFSWDSFFRRVDRGVKACERWGVKPLRAKSLRKATKWMMARFEQSDGLGAIFPPIIWSIIALKCLGHDDDSPAMRYNFQQLDKLVIEETDAARLQPCLSPVWDTAIALRALATAGLPLDEAHASAAAQWLLDKEVTQVGDWATNVQAEPAGWFFEHNNQFYPDVDDTVMVMIALKELLPSDLESVSKRESVSQIAAAAERQLHPRGVTRTSPSPALPLASGKLSKLERGLTGAGERARRWILAMQNKDGGWGAFDKDNDSEFLCHVPFADHNAMIDPSTPDLTGRVLEALALWGHRQDDPEIAAAIAYLRKTQEKDGSWYGRWGVNYIYGTWQALVGLAASGVAPSDPAIQQGANWLLAHQQPSGAWGESADSYEFPQLKGRGPATPSQTAWGILGLLAAGMAQHPAVAKAVQYLLETQQADGSWEETPFTGTGFPRVFYLKYHYYAIYFPLLALAEFRRQQADQQVCGQTDTCASPATCASPTISH